jgi:hypothetical protein
VETDLAQFPHKNSHPQAQPPGINARKMSLMDVTTIWTFLKTFVPLAISSTALIIVLLDRRPRLKLKSRSKLWYHLEPSVDRKSAIFFGMVEIYNVSARANAIRNYQIYWKKEGVWTEMEVDRYTDSSPGEVNGQVANHTPLVLPPYSGAEARIQGIIRVAMPYEMEVKVTVQDIFEKHYEVVVTATS